MMLYNYFEDIESSIDPYHDNEDTYAIDYETFIQDMCYNVGCEFEDTKTCELLESYLYETESEEFDELIARGRELFNAIKYSNMGVA